MGAFCECTRLTTVTIPNSVTIIDSEAFYNCNSLSSVTIPSFVTLIGRHTFFGCSSLASVYYGAKKPITGETNLFSDETYEKATLYMTEDGVVLSRTIVPWKKFKNIEAYDFPAGIYNVIADFDEDKPYEVYNLNGVMVGNSLEDATPGIYIVHQGRTVKKIVVK